MGHVFFAPDILTRQELPLEESQHCIRVLRLQEGDEILVSDGCGHLVSALIVEAHPKHCRLKILNTNIQEATWSQFIHIAMAPTKNMDRNEWFVEKATEIGINKISFLNCRFSERKEIKITRIEKILVAAMKQSLKAVLPKVEGIINFDKFIQEPFEGQKFIAHCHCQEKENLCKAYKPQENVLILIGPEGDFSEAEVEKANAQGFQSISLSHSRLRTETAALNACQTIHIVNDMS
ncbi:16S rRNA m(3)U1498 methyltransferase [Bacteroidales bacterium]|nr:16S rRNA m(3)U1498 methyltransferase [Bacteroidales bacterium]